jgi:Helix-turn-helix domain
MENDLLTIKQACAFLNVSRSTLWRLNPPCVMIGNLKRYRREDLLQGRVSLTEIERRAKDAADCAEKGESWEGATPV